MSCLDVLAYYIKTTYSLFLIPMHVFQKCEHDSKWGLKIAHISCTCFGVNMQISDLHVILMHGSRHNYPLHLLVMWRCCELNLWEFRFGDCWLAYVLVCICNQPEAGVEVLWLAFSDLCTILFYLSIYLFIPCTLPNNQSSLGSLQWTLKPQDRTIYEI